MLGKIAPSLLYPGLGTMELAMRGRLPKINFGDLKKICRMKTKQFHSYAKPFRTPDGPYFFKDNGADILAVAHLDTVLGFHHFEVTKLKQDTIINCTAIDDRLGVYTILKYLPDLGLKYDILLTTGEEDGNSTAAYFEPPKGKSYKWIFAFDLPEHGCKMYQYEDQKGKTAIETVGLKLQPNFAYSDIVALEHLQAKAFNFGTGYYAHHTMYAAASKKVWLSQIRAFIQFYRNNKNVSFPHLPKCNIFSLSDGFEYDPKLPTDFFDAEEFKFCQELMYEASYPGVTPEAFDTKLTKNVVRKAIEYKKNYGEHPYKMDPVVKGRIEPVVKNEDHNFKMGVGVIQHPIVKPGEPTLKEIQEKVQEAGRQTTALEVCSNCNDEFEIIRSKGKSIVSDWCPNCREKIIQTEYSKRSHAIYPNEKLSSVERKPQNLPPIVKEAKLGTLKTKIPLESKGEKYEYVLVQQDGQKIYKWRPIIKVGFEPVPKAQSKQV